MHHHEARLEAVAGQVPRRSCVDNNSGDRSALSRALDAAAPAQGIEGFSSREQLDQQARSHDSVGFLRSMYTFDVPEFVPKMP